MKEKIILIGGGGHCRSCIDVIEREGRYKIAGIVDVKERLHQQVLGYEILACDEDLQQIVRKYKNFLITIGQIKSAYERIKKFEYLKGLGARFPIIVSPFACVSKNAFIDEGTIIMHKAFVDANAKIGKNCIINTAAIIEHDVKIEDHCHISTASVINGGCLIETATFIGSNSVLVNNVSVAANTVIGAGSVVVKPIAEEGIYVGNIARKVNKHA